MNSFIVENGKITDWRVQMELCSIVSEFLKIKSKEDLARSYYEWADEFSRPYLDQFTLRSMEKLERFFPGKEFYFELTYGDYSNDSKESVLLGFNIGYSSKADESELNRYLKSIGDTPMSINWPCHTFCEVAIPELANRKIRY